MSAGTQQCFTNLDFPEIRGFPETLAPFWGKSVVWGPYSQDVLTPSTPKLLLHGSEGGTERLLELVFPSLQLLVLLQFFMPHKNGWRKLLHNSWLMWDCHPTTVEVLVSSSSCLLFSVQALNQTGARISLVQQRCCTEIIYRKYIYCIYSIPKNTQNLIQRLSRVCVNFLSEKITPNEKTRQKCSSDPPRVGYNQQIQHCTVYRNGCFGQKVPRCYDVHLLPARQETKTPPKNDFGDPGSTGMSQKRPFAFWRSWEVVLKYTKIWYIYICMIILYFFCTKYRHYLKHFMCLHLRQIAFKNSPLRIPQTSRKSDMDWQSAVHCLSNSTNLGKWWDETIYIPEN